MIDLYNNKYDRQTLKDNIPTDDEVLEDVEVQCCTGCRIKVKGYYQTHVRLDDDATTVLRSRRRRRS